MSVKIIPIAKITSYANQHNTSKEELSALIIGKEVIYLNKTYIVKYVDKKGFFKQAFLVGKTGKVSTKKYIHITSNVVEERQQKIR